MNQPWKNEPNSVYWVDRETNYSCAIQRNVTTGALCGYVGIPPKHPWHGQTYNSRVKPPKGYLDQKINIDEVGVMNLFLASEEQDGLYENCIVNSLSWWNNLCR